MELTQQECTDLTVAEILAGISNKEAYDLVKTDRHFAARFRQYSYEEWRPGGGGLRGVEIVPCSGSADRFRPEVYDKDEVIVAGGLVVGVRNQRYQEIGLQLYGIGDPVDPYLFLAALASGGITGNRASLHGYNLHEWIDIPVIERTVAPGRFQARDIVMTVEMACDLARVLEEDLGIEA